MRPLHASSPPPPATPPRPAFIMPWHFFPLPHSNLAAFFDLFLGGRHWEFSPRVCLRAQTSYLPPRSRFPWCPSLLRPAMEACRRGKCPLPTTYYIQGATVHLHLRLLFCAAPPPSPFFPRTGAGFGWVRPVLINTTSCKYSLFFRNSFARVGVQYGSPGRVLHPVFGLPVVVIYLSLFSLRGIHTHTEYI